MPCNDILDLVKVGEKSPLKFKNRRPQRNEITVVQSAKRHEAVVQQKVCAVSAASAIDRYFKSVFSWRNAESSEAICFPVLDDKEHLFVHLISAAVGFRGHRLHY